MSIPRSEGPFRPGAPRAPRIRIFLPGTELGRRFDVTDVLGSGGSSVVYAARERATGRDVALKLFRQERLSEHAVERLRREIEAVRASGSARLAPVDELGRSGDVLFAVAPRLPAVTLRQRMAEGPLPIEEALHLACGVLEALSELHALGVLHRDLKPGNVFLAQDGAVLLADYGLGRTWEREAPDDASIDYIAPEQATGGHVDAPSDLYSVGVLLFEMLTGRLPFHGGTSLGTAVAHMKERAPDPRAARPEVPEWLARVVARLLAKDAARRYASAAEVLADLALRRAQKARLVALPERWWLGALVVLAFLAALLAWRSFAHPRFARLVFDEVTGLKALDGDGRLLWSHADLSREKDAWPVRVRRRVPDQVATLMTHAHETDPAYNRFLILLHADTGEVAAGIFLPDLAGSFALPDTYRASLAAVDLDDGGRDDVLVTYENVRGPGSYTLLYDPRNEETLPIFLSTGAQTVLGTADVDGDGRREVLLASVNEAMGGTAAVAAVRVPPEGRFPRELRAEALAASPDRDHPRGIGGLAFYALIPSASLPLAARVDEGWRVIELDRAEGGRLLLGYDGFLRRDRSPRPPGERSRARARAYDALRDAARLAAAGYYAEAVPKGDEALAAAEKAADRTLAEWTVRLKARALVGAGRWDEAETELDGLSARSDLAVPIARDAARAFHLAGELGSAVRWYRRGLSALKGSAPGYHPEELLEGLVLALGELRRWEEAVDELDRYALADPLRAGSARFLRAYTLFRATGRSEQEGLSLREATELERALAFELRAAAGEPAEALIPAVSREIARARSARPLLESLRAVLLSRAGRHLEAVPQARVAAAAMRARAAHDVVCRANLRLAESRYASVLREARRAARAPGSLAR